MNIMHFALCTLRITEPRAIFRTFRTFSNTLGLIYSKLFQRLQVEITVFLISSTFTQRTE